MKIVALSGGVGGAKLADGLAHLLPAEDLTIIVNTGDDLEHWGLFISPDLDTVCYTLAGLANPETGWGQAGETFHTLENIQRLGGPGWFHIGDKDLATHIERTRLIHEHHSLSKITSRFCLAWGIEQTILPMSDQMVRTIVDTVEQGELPFQVYFVRENCEPNVRGFRFDGMDSAQAAPGVREAIRNADAVIIGPSNPWVSIDPILAIKEIRESLAGKIVVAISPIISGKTIKGPAAKMFSELGIEPSALAVNAHFAGLLSGFILDNIDARLKQEVALPVLVTQTIMKTPEDRRILAAGVIDFIRQLIYETNGVK